MKAILLILLLSGCSTLSAIHDKTSESIAKAVIAYCATTIEIERAVLRADLNTRLEGFAEVKITCEI